METTLDRPHTEAGTRALAWGVLVASVLQVAAPAVTINGPGNSPGNGSGPELLITPAGWAFSIWGVIYALAIVQAVSVLARGADAVPRRLQIDQIALYLAGVLWIVLAGLDSSLATAGALLLMLLAAVDGVLTAARVPMTAGWLTVLTRTAIGLYAGWVTAAFFLNASTALVDADVVEADVLSWQIGVLILAAVALTVVTIAVRGILAYAAAGAWALLGIGVTGSSNDTPEVIWIAAISAVVLLATAAATRLKGMHPATSS